MENEVAHIPFIALGHKFQLADRQSMHGWGKALVKTCFTTRGPILIYHRPSACHFGRRIQCRHQSTHGQKCISHTTTVSFSLKASGTSCEQGGEGVGPGEGRGGGGGKGGGRPGPGKNKSKLAIATNNRLRSQLTQTCSGRKSVMFYPKWRNVGGKWMKVEELRCSDLHSVQDGRRLNWQHSGRPYNMGRSWLHLAAFPVSSNRLSKIRKNKSVRFDWILRINTLEVSM